MLACARIGALHVAVPGDASIQNIAEVVDHTTPKTILTASDHATSHKTRLDKVLALGGHQPAACLVLQRTQVPVALEPPRDRDWRMLWEEGVNYAKTSDCVPLAAGHPLCILPDGAMRDHGGSMVALAMSTKAILAAGNEAPRIADVATPAAQSTIYGALLCGQAVRLVESAAASDAHALPWNMPVTIDDPAILDEIGAALKAGIGAGSVR
jgi:propionyl-CoA synthetase